jgi:hypothetical protein
MMLILILLALTAVLAIAGTIVTTVRDGYGPTADARIPAQRPFV